MRRYLFLFICTILLLEGCARKNFFQESALVGTIEKENNAQWDSATVVAGKHYDRSWWHNLWWGKHYRDVWAQPVRLPVLDLQRMHGGLSPEKLGGGMQTTSLTLEDDNGKQFALRSVDKDPQEILPKGLRKTFLTNLLRDQTSAAHPYGAVVVSQLAAGARIYHSHPRFVYIRKNAKGLGDSASAFQDKVFLLEEKNEGKEALTRYFGKAKDLVDSEDFLKNRFTRHSHLPNQQAFAKARLFDVFIGDWDRHEGQWQWAVYDTGRVTSYSPVPKDRDQAFFKFDDGFFPWLLSRRWAPLRKMKSFHTNISSVKGYLENAQFIDARVLNEVTAEQWQQAALELQRQLTDSVLEASVAALPAAVYDLSGKKILAKLKSRRQQLPKAAAHLYRRLAAEVLIAGTDQQEKFIVERQPNGNTLVQVFQVPEDEKQKPLKVYERLLEKDHTRSVNLYGLGEEDEFELTGKASKGIRVNIYGGMGEDEVKDKSEVRGWGRKTRVYDTRQGIEVEKSKETRVKKSKDVAIHAFDREGL
ncbi:hypothetical protein [Rufibacter ruber]|uniref:hypothetical protein n=1 Tax=Rufibacter ruber TaxID=1783499 RepID=UPI0008368A93|nr:hypothetical protein [Rufibacter ruber]